MIVKGPREDVESYLDAIEQLRGNIKFFSNNKSFKSSDAVVNHVNNLLVKAVSNLEEEFKKLLSVYRQTNHPIALLHNLAKQMVQAGCHQQVLKIYRAYMHLNSIALSRCRSNFASVHA